MLDVARCLDYCNISVAQVNGFGVSSVGVLHAGSVVSFRRIHRIYVGFSHENLHVFYFSSLSFFPLSRCHLMQYVQRIGKKLYLNKT